MNLIPRFLFIGLALMSFFQLHSQNPKNASCSDRSFDKKVRSLIQYRVPVLDVDSLAAHPSQYLILDAREREEFDVSHLPEAQFAGYKHFDIEDWKDIDKNTRIVVYCSVGYRSEKIGKKLKKAGFTHVFNLYGGLFEWVNRHHPLAGDSKKVHTYNKKWSRWVMNPAVVKVW
ncbi:MAG TPA: rhodanese-like domain-containing protein [Saprospiraceae bacterium]|nr:rhodanese-like domain-containing protein [Saprospiraceae bacterium]